MNSPEIFFGSLRGFQIPLQDIIDNKVNGECKKRFNFFPFLRLFNESFDSIPKLKNDADPVKNHAEQFRQVKQRSDLRTGTVGDEEQGLQTILSDWSKIADQNTAPLPHPPINYLEVRKIRQHSKVVYFSAQNLYLAKSSHFAHGKTKRNSVGTTIPNCSVKVAVRKNGKDNNSVSVSEKSHRRRAAPVLSAAGRPHQLEFSFI